MPNNQTVKFIKSPKTHAQPSNHGKIWTQPEIDLLLELMHKNNTTGDIARALGRTKLSIETYLYKLTQAYHKSGMDPEDIADKLNIDDSTIRDWITSHVMVMYKQQVRKAKKHLQLAIIAYPDPKIINVLNQLI